MLICGDFPSLLVCIAIILISHLPCTQNHLLSDSCICRLQRGLSFYGTTATSRIWSNKTAQSYCQSSSRHWRTMQGATGIKPCRAWPSMYGKSSLMWIRSSLRSVSSSTKKMKQGKKKPRADVKQLGSAWRISQPPTTSTEWAPPNTFFGSSFGKWMSIYSTMECIYTAQGSVKFFNTPSNFLGDGGNLFTNPPFFFSQIV